MPFLRFTRDKRGYETTALVHSSRRHGRAAQQILYWFRTPPGVKVGRPALDEEAIRWIEEHNPEIEFDWPKILQAQPPPPVEEPKIRRAKGGRTRERPRQGQTPVVREARAVAERPVAEPAIQEPELEEVEPEREESVQMPAASPPVPAVEAVDHAQLVRLRARYAEILARIAERGEAEGIEALRAQAEALNPDTWVTADEVRKGHEEFESRIRDLRAALGLRRRRRSRRGGRRRRRGEEPPIPQSSGPGESSNQEEGAPDEDDEEGYTESS